MYKKITMDLESGAGRAALRQVLNDWLAGVLLPRCVIKHYVRCERKLIKFVELREKIIFEWYALTLLASDEYDRAALPGRDPDEYKQRFVRFRHFCERFNEMVDSHELSLKRSIKKEIGEWRAIRDEE